MLGCMEGEIKLVNDDNFYTWNEKEGSVMICMMGEWRFVCDDGWDQMAANVFCKEMGWFSDCKFTPPLSGCICTLTTLK